jgi:hypothetical protein
MPFINVDNYHVEGETINKLMLTSPGGKFTQDPCAKE